MLQQSGHLLSGFRDNIDKRDLLAFPTVRVFHHRHRSPSHPHGHPHGHSRWRSSPWSSPLWRSSSRWSTASPMPMQVQAANSGPAKYKGLTDVVLSLYRFSIRISIIAAIVLIITTIRIMLILIREGGLRSIFRGSAATAARGESFTFHNFFSFLHTIYKCASYLHGNVLLRVWSLHNVHWLVWDFIFENGEELRSRKTVGGLLRKNSWTNLEAGWFFSCFFSSAFSKKCNVCEILNWQKGLDG